MSKIKDAMMIAEENCPEFHEAMDNWETEKASQIMFKAVFENGKKKLVNVR